MNYPTCPINTQRNERAYYVNEIARNSKKIKDGYKKLYKHEFNCPAYLIKQLLNTDAFVIQPKPEHSHETRDLWLAAIAPALFS